MAQMKVVIEIDEELYKEVCTSPILDWGFAVPMYHALKEGTPLPKGHGRLIDADALRHTWVDVFDSAYGDACALRFKHSIEYMPTIIEADKESE